MFLKCFWLLRKPSDQKNIFIDERFDYIWIFMSTKIWRLCTFCLAKISLWSVWRDLREAKCVDLVVNYMKSSNFCGSPLSFKVFKALRRLPKRLKTLELRSGDTHKNSNVPQMLLAFWGNRLIKKIFLLMNGSITFEFLCPQKFEDFSCTFCLAKISMECMERFKRSKMCGLGGELYENLQIFVDLHQFQSF